MRSERLLLLAALLSAGCPALDPNKGLQTAPAAQSYDYNAFVCGAMPVLVRHCSYLACHGNAAHAFRVYSPGKLRAGDVASRNDRDAPLTSDEVQANFDSASGILLAGPPPDGTTLVLQRAPLLQKPLKAAFGGSEHHGIGIFPFAPAQSLDADPEWSALVAWAAGQRQPVPPAAECQAFFTSLGLPAR